MRHLRKVRDPLYGYVYLSELENRMIKHPLMLRLHYLHQNGTAYLTYPSAHPMRFGHSLGTMHVAGELVVAGLINATAGIDASLIAAVNSVIDKSKLAEGRSGSEVLDELCANGPEIELLNNDGLYRLHSLNNHLQDKAAMVRLLVYQGVRLACLVHDLGHPPFSHTTEGAFQQVLSEGEEHYKNHEDVGRRILAQIIDDLAKDRSTSQFAHVALVLAAVLSEKDGVSSLRGIAEIVSSDVDADRVDYVRRDTMTAGLVATSYDLGRLLDAATFYVDSSTGMPRLVFTTDALSMLEAFFQSRFHLYRWMLWHHNVLRINLALSRATYLLLSIPESSLPASVLSIRGEIRAVASLKDGPARYCQFTDSSFYAHLDRILELLDAAGSTLHPGAQELRRMLRVFIRRETSLLPALWKRPDAYFQFADIVIKELKRQGRTFTDGHSIPAMNKLLKDRYGVHSTKMVGHKPKAELAMCNEIEGVLQRVTGKPFKAAYLSSFSPTPKEGFALYTRSDLKEIDIDRISPTISSLRQVWNHLPHLWLFAETQNGERIEVESTRTEAARALAEYLLQR